MITRISRKDLERKILFFQRKGIKYRMKNTNERTEVRAEGRWGDWMNKESSFKPQSLNFIKRVKAHVIKNGTYKKVKNIFKKEGSHKKIKYNYFNKNYNQGDYIENVIEIDIKHAYWKTAYKLGLFDEPMYNEGLTVDKRPRLAAVGSFAKVTEVIDFDGEKETYLDPERQTETEFLWSVISYRIGKIMAKAMRACDKKLKGKPSDFIFFWVDAIFIRGEYKDEVIKVFKDAGFDVSTYKCEWVRFDENKIIVHSKEKGKWIVKRERERVVINGRKMIKTTTTKTWTELRPFPYKKTMSEIDIVKLSSDQ